MMNSASSLIGLVDQLQGIESQFSLVLMEAAMKLASFVDASVLVLVDTPDGRSWVGRKKLKDDFLQNRLQLGPNDNEFVVNPDASSLLRQPSVAEKEASHQMLLQQQQQNKERLVKKLIQGKRPSDTTLTPPQSKQPHYAPGEPRSNTQKITVKKVNYREKCRATKALEKPKVETVKVVKVGRYDDDQDDDSSRDSTGTSAETSERGSIPREEQPPLKSQTVQSHSSKVHGQAGHAQKGQRVTKPAAVEDDDSFPDSEDESQRSKRRNGVGGAKSDGDEAASDDGSWALDLVTPPQKSPPLKKTPANRDSLPPDVYVPIDADVSPETQEKFERAKSLDMHEIFDTSTSSYKLMSSVIYDFATHWARQCPILGHKGQEVNAFFGERFEDWFRNFQGEMSNMQVRSFFRTMAMKNYSCQRNRIMKKLQNF